MLIVARSKFSYALICLTIIATCTTSIGRAQDAGASITLVGAGDIASCDGHWEENGARATAKIVKDILRDKPAGRAFAFTLGDNFYQDPSKANNPFPGKQNIDCFKRSWGHKDLLYRTFPVVGNHDREYWNGNEDPEYTKQEKDTEVGYGKPTALYQLYDLLHRDLPNRTGGANPFGRRRDECEGASKIGLCEQIGEKFYRGYYDKRLGVDWVLLVLDSSYYDGPHYIKRPERVLERFIPDFDAHYKAQENWLDKKLVEHRGRCIVAIWHHPVCPQCGESEHGGVPVGFPETEREKYMKKIWSKLHGQPNKGRASLVLTGHHHIFRKFKPLDADLKELKLTSLPQDGLTQITVGTGGTTTSQTSIAPNPELTDGVGTDREVIDNRHGVIVVDLFENRLTWYFRIIIDANHPPGNGPDREFHYSGKEENIRHASSTHKGEIACRK